MNIQIFTLFLTNIKISADINSFKLENIDKLNDDIWEHIFREAHTYCDR